MQLVFSSVLALVTRLLGASAAPQDIYTGASFSLKDGGESSIVTTRLTDSISVACCTDSGNEESGLCRVLETDAELSGSAGSALVTATDKTLHNSITGLADDLALWCYVDSENAGQIFCRKLVLADDGNLTVGYEQSVGSSESNWATLVSVAAFSSSSAVVCYDNPQAAVTGRVDCALLVVTGDGDLVIQSPLPSTVHPVESDATSISITRLSDSSGLACYTTSAPSCECATLTVSDTALAVDVPMQLSASDSEADVVASRLSDESGIICYTQGGAAVCVELVATAGNLTRGAEVVLSASASSLSVEGFSGEHAAVCYEGTSLFECYALDLSDGEFVKGNRLELDDASPDSKVAISKTMEDSGVLCYTSSIPGSNGISDYSGRCMAIQVSAMTTTTETSTSLTTTSGTTTSGTTVSETTVSTTPHTTTETTLTSITGLTTTRTSITGTESSSTTPHTTTASSTTTETSSTTPHTTTETSSTWTTSTEGPVLSCAIAQRVKGLLVAASAAAMVLA